MHACMCYMFVCTLHMHTCVNVYINYHSLLPLHTAEFVTSHVTIWLAVDLATSTGCKLFKNGLEYMVCEAQVISFNGITVIVLVTHAVVTFLCSNYLGSWAFLHP